MITNNKNQRNDGRALNQVRDIRITTDVFEYAAGSVLLELGKTKILCAVSLQTGVPPFLKGKRTGWLTAEYAMLPAATTIRSTREAESGRRNGRSIEISRFIGRSLRTIVDLSKIGERTIIIDCDVLQADGSTRTACITAASLALELAQERWLETRCIAAPIMQDAVAAVSIGLRNGDILVDLNFEEDSAIDADFNIVVTKSGKFVEMQGAAERCLFSLQELYRIQEVALSAVGNMFTTSLITQQPSEKQIQEPFVVATEKKAPLFSLQNRLNGTI